MTDEVNNLKMKNGQWLLYVNDWTRAMVAGRGQRPGGNTEKINDIIWRGGRRTTATVTATAQFVNGARKHTFDRSW